MKRKEPAAHRPNPHHSTHNDCTESGRQAVHDVLGAIRRRPYKPSTGLRASGYREGYAAALRWMLRDGNLDSVTSARLTAIVARSEAA